MTDLALDPRSGEDALPLAPVRLPEFGQSVSWLMCRSFGIPFNGPLPGRRDRSVGDARCRDCGHSFPPPSNPGVRVLAMPRFKS